MQKTLVETSDENGKGESKQSGLLEFLIISLSGCAPKKP
jgi:hypothetical protein